MILTAQNVTGVMIQVRYGLAQHEVEVQRLSIHVKDVPFQQRLFYSKNKKPKHLRNDEVIGQ